MRPTQLSALGNNSQRHCYDSNTNRDAYHNIPWRQVCYNALHAFALHASAASAFCDPYKKSLLERWNTAN